jgi:hypothetical protein
VGARHYAPPKYLDVMFDGTFGELLAPDTFTETVTGSGIIGLTPRRYFVGTGTTATSTALMRTTDFVSWSRGKARRTINWSKRVDFVVDCSAPGGTTNGITRVTIGKHTGDGIADLTDKGIGFKFLDRAIHGHYYGSSAKNIDLSTSMSSDNVASIRVTSYGDGRVEWYVNDVLAGSATDGPTGDSTTSHTCAQAETDNGGDAASQQIDLASWRYRIAA